VRSYELMIIHRPELPETAVRAAVGDVENAIAEAGAVTSTDFWGKRRFAYEIDHLTEGYYSVVEFEGDNPLVERLDRALSLSDAVIRHKILRRSER